MQIMQGKGISDSDLKEYSNSTSLQFLFQYANPWNWKTHFVSNLFLNNQEWLKIKSG